MNKNVLITNQMMLREKTRFERWLIDLGIRPTFLENDQFLNEKECLKLSPNFDGWLAGDDEITEKVMKRLTPKLRVISKWGTGLDSIDLQAADRLGIKVKNSKGAFAEPVSEIAIAYILDLYRKVTETDRLVRLGEWPKFQTRSVCKENLGIVGFGAIGRKIAQKANALGMNVFFCDPYIEKSYKKYKKFQSLQALVSDVDVLCLSCNLTSQTRNLINEKIFKLMKRGSYLVNVSRGGLVNQKDMLKYLQNGTLAGIALDVYSTEPPANEYSIIHSNQIILGSHNANNTSEVVEAVHEKTIKNLVNNLMRN